MLFQRSGQLCNTDFGDVWVGRDKCCLATRLMAAEAGNPGNGKRGQEREFSETRDQKALYLVEWVEQDSLRCCSGHQGERAVPCEITEMLEAEGNERGPPGTRGRIRGEREEEDIQADSHRGGRAESTRSHNCNCTKQWEAEGSAAHPSTARPRAWRWQQAKASEAHSHSRIRQTEAEARRTVRLYSCRRKVTRHLDAGGSADRFLCVSAPPSVPGWPQPRTLCTVSARTVSERLGRLRLPT